MSRSGGGPSPLLSSGRRRLGGASVVVALLAAAAAPAGAEVQGSPHDLAAHGYAAGKGGQRQDRCGRCHIPSSPSGPNLLLQLPASLAAYTPSTLLCFSCHDGTTFVSPEVDASATAFHPRSHALGPASREAAAPVGETLPLTSDGRLECVTCHDPHTNTNRPFLRASLSELCVNCHLREFGRETGAENLLGNHPEGIDPARQPRPAAPIAVEEPFRVPLPATYPLEGGSTRAGVHWDLGGHLEQGDTGAVVCVSCHAVHGDERTPPLPELLATDPVRATADLFCEGCHAGRRGDGRDSPPRPNPGGTLAARTYHPADDDASNGEGPILETRQPANWPLGTGSPRAILCSTCHRAHQATPRSSLLRPPTPGTAFCGECHERMTLEYHHPLIEDGSGPCAGQLRLEDPVTGLKRSCDLCHRAHNAGLGSGREPEYVPLLRERLLAEGQCLSCHPQKNPTCIKDPDGSASHFLGDPTLPETFESGDPPLRRIVWPESRLPSLFAGERGQTVICLSCHSFREGAVISGDDGKQRFLLARSGNPVEWEDDENIYLCTGCHTVNPGTGTKMKGHTHPLMNARVSALGRSPEAPVTGTPNGRINCDSCHRPHAARTAGGYYILETLESENRDPLAVHPQIDFTPVCHSCHEKGKY